MPRTNDADDLWRRAMHGELMLRADVRLAPFSGGVIIRSDSGSIILRNADYDTVRSLLRRIGWKGPDRKADAHGSPPLSGQHAAALLSTLHENHLVEERPQGGEQLSDAERQQFAAQLDWLAHVSAEPLQKFLNIRKSSVVVVGSGTAAGSCAANLLANGIGHVVRAHGADDPECPPRAAAVVYCSDYSSLDECSAANRIAVRCEAVFLPTVLSGEHWLIGPAVLRPLYGCGVCALVRLSGDGASDNTIAEVIGRNRGLQANWNCTESARRGVGREAALHVFRLLTNERVECRDAVLVCTAGTKHVVGCYLSGCSRYCQGWLAEADWKSTQ